MLAKRVIPCLDVHDGQVTRGVQFGKAEEGGLRNVGDPVELALRYNEQRADEMVFYDITAGADKTSINSSALATPDLIREGAEKFGSQCIVVSIDAKRTGPEKWEVFSHGGRKPTGLDAIEWAREVVELGAGEIVLNSIDAD